MMKKEKVKKIIIFFYTFLLLSIMPKKFTRARYHLVLLYTLDIQIEIVEC